jgi:hypothetical protein
MTTANTNATSYVDFPYKKDFSTGTVMTHWANLERPDQGKPEFNINPNHQIRVRIDQTQKAKLDAIAAEIGATKGISGLTEQRDADGSLTGMWLLTLKTRKYTTPGPNQAERFPETYNVDSTPYTGQISRGDEVIALATPGLVKLRKTMTLYLKKVTLVKKGEAQPTPNAGF